MVHLSVHTSTKNNRKAVAFAVVALTQVSWKASLIPLLAISAASAAASIRLYRSFHQIPSSFSSADAAIEVFSSSSKAILSTTLANCQLPRIWNVKKKSEVLTIVQTSAVWNDLFWDYQSEFSFRLPVWFFPDCQSEMNPKQSEENLNLKTQSEIRHANLKTVWNQSEANLKNALI